MKKKKEICSSKVRVDFTDLKRTIDTLTDEYEDELNKVSVDEMGIFKDGLTDSELKEYLALRNSKQKVKIKNTYRKFCKIAGINTKGAVICPECGKPISLMYRCDVERFADQLFDGKKTYWD